jgi:hypothetical protein
MAWNMKNGEPTQGGDANVDDDDDDSYQISSEV